MENEWTTAAWHGPATRWLGDLLAFVPALCPDFE